VDGADAMNERWNGPRINAADTLSHQCVSSMQLARLDLFRQIRKLAPFARSARTTYTVGAHRLAYEGYSGRA
jgi:hypothetical protein